MNDNENKTNAPTIKLPVRYFPPFSEIQDADGDGILRVNGAGQEKRDRIAPSIVAALNEADALRDERDDLAIFVRRFVNSRFVSPCPVKEQAQDYLNRKGLAGSILRDAAIKPNAEEKQDGK